MAASKKPSRYSRKPTRRRLPARPTVKYGLSGPVRSNVQITGISELASQGKPIAELQTVSAPEHLLTITGATVRRQNYEYTRYKVAERMMHNHIVGRGIVPALHDAGFLNTKPKPTHQAPATDLTPEQAAVLVALCKWLIPSRPDDEAHSRKLADWGLDPREKPKS